jgi:hypothetical protein
MIKMLMTFFSGFKEGAQECGMNITIIINTVLLFIVYVFGVGITSIIAKISRKHFMDTKLDKKSYWTQFNLSKKPLKEYYRQF